MPFHMKSDATVQSSVTALLHTLREELDRTKMRADELVSKPQTSIRCRLGPRAKQLDMHIRQGTRSSNLAGAIFMCNRRTWKECIGQCLFGLPVSKKNVVDQIAPGMKLFLFEYENRQLWGVFEATSYGDMNIIPNAYSGGSFPCQVRVTVPEECVALYEEEFCEAIRENYYSMGKFHFELSDAQVRHLSSLFEIKHLRAKRMHSGLVDVKEKQCISERCQVIQRQCSLGPEAHLVSTYRRLEVFDRASFVGAFDIVEDSCIPLDVASLTKLGGQLGTGLEVLNASKLRTNNHAVLEVLDTGDIIPVLSTVTKQETDDSFFLPNDVSLLRSDRPRGKSVWERISGRAKPLLASASIVPHEKVDDYSMPLSPPKLSAKDSMPLSRPNVSAKNVLSDAQAGGLSEDAAEDFPIGFKRRRMNSSIPAKNSHEKRRRKLTRPSFEVLAESVMEVAVSAPSLGEVGKTVTENLCMWSADDTPNVLDTSHVEKTVDNGSTVLEQVVESFCSDFKQQGAGVCHQSDTLDLNLRTFEQDRRVGIYYPNLKTSMTDNGFSEIKIPIVDKEAEVFPDREPCPSLLVQNDLAAVSLRTDNMHGNNSTVFGGHSTNLQQGLTESEETCRVITDQSGVCQSGKNQAKEGVGAPGDGISPRGTAGCLVSCTQAKEFVGSFDDTKVPPNVSQGVDKAKEGVGAPGDGISPRGTAACLVSCTQAKEFVGSFDDTKVPPNVSQGVDKMAEDAPLTWIIANGMQLSNVKLHVSDSIHAAHVFEDASRRDGTSSSENGSNLCNQIDLKSFLQRGLQVSGIKLQLGPSPQLILQLGDAISGVDNQAQEVATPSNQHEACLDERVFESSPMQRVAWSAGCVPRCNFGTYRGVTFYIGGGSLCRRL